MEELTKRLHEAETKCRKLREAKKRQSEQLEILRGNNGSLLLTARNEIRRKETEIQTLRKE